MPKGPMTRQRTRTPDPPPAEQGLIVSPSSSHVMPQPPTGTQTDACDGDEGGPEEFRIYADEELEEKIKRLSRKQTFALPDGDEKMRKFVYRMRKELDRRRAARPRKVDTGHEQALQIVSGDDPCAFMPPPVENTSNHAPDKKLQESVCQVEKELDHRLTAGPGKVDTGDGQAVEIVGGNDSRTLMPPPVDNASNHARVINSEATDGGLNPLASPNLEEQAVTSTNVGAEEVQPTAYTCPRQKGEDTGKKGQLSQMAMLLEVENYLELNMKQIQKLVEEVKEAPKQEDRFTIEKCVAALEAIEELTYVEKAKALRLFKCSLNRKIFMSTKSATVRLIWLKREIDA